MRYLKRRLGRLEQRVPERSSRCPDRPPVVFITEDADGNVVEGEYLKPCRTCGGPHGGVSFVIVSTQRASSSDMLSEST
jgi:hypothetical protein